MQLKKKNAPPPSLSHEKINGLKAWSKNVIRALSCSPLKKAFKSPEMINVTNKILNHASVASITSAKSKSNFVSIVFWKRVIWSWASIHGGRGGDMSPPRFLVGGGTSYQMSPPPRSFIMTKLSEKIEKWKEKWGKKILKVPAGPPFWTKRPPLFIYFVLI